jgi:hypothetical protein
VDALPDLIKARSLCSLYASSTTSMKITTPTGSTTSAVSS